MNKWISVKDKLPEAWKRVLIFAPHEISKLQNNITVGYYVYSNKCHCGLKKSIDEDTNSYIFDEDECNEHPIKHRFSAENLNVYPTHWMPLFATPYPVEDEDSTSNYCRKCKK